MLKMLGVLFITEHFKIEIFQNIQGKERVYSSQNPKTQQCELQPPPPKPFLCMRGEEALGGFLGCCLSPAVNSAPRDEEPVKSEELSCPEHVPRLSTCHRMLGGGLCLKRLTEHRFISLHQMLCV